MEPFEIKVPEATLEDLAERLSRTRWPDEVEDSGWDYGAGLDYLRELADYWQDGFDWRAREEYLNGFAHYRTEFEKFEEFEGFGLHFIHERGKGPDPTPLLLTHGWPDSFFRMHKLIPLLTDPERFGGDPQDSFDVVVPSLPGYGFSDRPAEPGFGARRIAGLFDALMRSLGYEKYAAHGGDWGSTVTEQLALRHPDSLTGIHLTDVPFGHIFAVPPDELSSAEQEYISRGRDWAQSEGAYAMIQATKPQTLAYGLNDSPVGLAAWIVEKFRAWSDCDGDVEKSFSRDELLTNVMIYWITQTVGSSCRLYYESQHGGSTDRNERAEIPTSVAVFPKDLVNAPREYAERFFDVRRWTEMPRGGHFAALEESELLAGDLRESFRESR